MKKRNPLRYFKTSPEIIRLAVMLYIRFPLSLRNVEDMLHAHGVEISHDRVENTHQPLRRRERAMQRFRRMSCLQKFAAAHASIHNHFNHERQLISRAEFKRNRNAALAEWRQLGSA
jgi:transposase-like protein